MSNHYRVGDKDIRAWGYFTVLHTGPAHTCKVLVVWPGGCLSLQTHQFRAEHWVVCQGTATVQLGEEVCHIPSGEHVFIAAQQRHCLANNTEQDLVLIEVQTGSKLAEDDIIRYQPTQNLLSKEHTK